MGYSLNRYRPLKQIDPTTVKRLARIWNLSLDNPWARPQLRHRLQYLTPLAATRAIQPLRCLSKSRLSLKHPAFAALAKAHRFCKLIELCLRRLGPQRGRQAEHLSQTRQIEARVAGPPRYRGKSAKMARKRKSERPCREISTNCREVARSASGQKVVFLQSVNGAPPWAKSAGSTGPAAGRLSRAHGRDAGGRSKLTAARQLRMLNLWPHRKALSNSNVRCVAIGQTSSPMVT